jgi:hypothetical protein
VAKDARRDGGDGHHVAFAMGGAQVEIWAMDNIPSILKTGR